MWWINKEIWRMQLSASDEPELVTDIRLSTDDSLSSLLILCTPAAISTMLMSFCIPNNDYDWRACMNWYLKLLRPENENCFMVCKRTLKAGPFFSMQRSRWELALYTNKCIEMMKFWKTSDPEASLAFPFSKPKKKSIQTRIAWDILLQYSGWNQILGLHKE